jgi:hypothetical protein
MLTKDFRVGNTAMTSKKLAICALLAVSSVRAATGLEFPNQVNIRSEHWGWGSSSTNLTLTLTNGVFSAGRYTVAPSLISNLLAAAKRPWPKPPANSWPPFSIDTQNLGLTRDWLKTNYDRLLRAYSAEEGPVFPNTSQRQRAWLTNALADINLLAEALRGPFGGIWTDDYPTLELRFERSDGQGVEQILLLKTTAQPSFMLPWEVNDGTNQCTSGNADISRAVVEILPNGFLNRDRLSGDLFEMIKAGFVNLQQVLEFMRESTLQQTLEDEGVLLAQGFELRGPAVRGGSFMRFPESFTANLHRTNWPHRLIMPVQTGIYLGVVTNLKAIMTNADARVAPLLQQGWFLSRLNSSTNLSAEVQAEGSPDHQWLRGHMDKVGRAGFYDRIAPDLRRSLDFRLREGYKRSSEWAVLDDGRLLVYGFTGDGVLDWRPDELGFKDDPRLLRTLNINRIGVFVGPQGQITEAVQPQEE